MKNFHTIQITNLSSPFIISFCLFLTFQNEIQVKAIVLDQKEDGLKFNKLRAEDLSKMRQLKLLILDHKNFSGMPMSLSNSLCYLSWNGCPFISLPSNFQPCNLVELNMPNSSIKQLWEGIQVLLMLLSSFSVHSNQWRGSINNITQRSFKCCC